MMNRVNGKYVMVWWLVMWLYCKLNI